MLLGIDVSKHQGAVNFREARVNGQMRFAILKATEGADYEDPRFAESWNKLLVLDPSQNPGGPDVMVRGAYHFARNDLRADQGRKAGELEARHFCKVLRRVGKTNEGALPPALDWERYGSTVALNREWIRGFVDVVRGELGRSPMIYTGRNVWYYTTGDFDELVDLPLWQVAYQKNGGDPSSTPPTMLSRSTGRRPWKYTLWQWSGGGQFEFYNKLVPGLKGDVDVNRFDGTWTQMLALANIGVTTTPTPPTPTPTPTPTGPTVPTPDATILVTFDLANVPAGYHERSAMVQGLLMANGYGPTGMVGANGLPDGRPGPLTLATLARFKREHGLADNTIVDIQTWWMLLATT